MYTVQNSIARMAFKQANRLAVERRKSGRNSGKRVPKISANWIELHKRAIVRMANDLIRIQTVTA